MGLGSVLKKAGNIATGGALGAATSAIGGVAANKASNKATEAELQAIQNAQANASFGNAASTDDLRGAQQQSYEAQLGQLNNITGQNQPYVDAGQQGLMGLTDMQKNGGFQNPEFQFNPNDVTHSPFFAQLMNDAMKALTRSAAGKSRLFSGGTAQELLDYSKKINAQDYVGEYGRQFGLAEEKYNSGRQNVQDQYARMLGLSDIGERATGRIGSAETNFGNQVQGLNQTTANQIAAGDENLGTNLANLNLQTGNVQASGYKERAGILNNTLSSVTGNVGDLIGLSSVRK